MDIVAQALQRVTEGLVQPGWGSTGELVDLLGTVFPEEGCCGIMLLYNVKICHSYWFDKILASTGGKYR